MMSKTRCGYRLPRMEGPCCFPITDRALSLNEEGTDCGTSDLMPVFAVCESPPSATRPGPTMGGYGGARLSD